MRKVIAAINITIDGFCDHTAGIPDEDLHDHYADLLKNSDAVLYGRTTFQLMQYWQELLKHPSGDKSMDGFALAIDQVPKIVFSTTLRQLDWESARLSGKSPEETVAELKQEPGKDILIGSRSLIVQLANLKLVDEFQLCIHPVIIGKGLPLFDDIQERTILQLTGTKKFSSGIVIHYYKS